MAETCPDITLYTFLDYGKPFWKSLEKWSELMFSTSHLKTIDPDINRHIIRECKRVNGEFHQRRTDANLNSKMKQIFKLQGIEAPSFSCGNSDTFDEDVEVLAKELEEIRKLYRERPVLVCIYSPLNLHKTQVH